MSQTPIGSASRVGKRGPIKRVLMINHGRAVLYDGMQQIRTKFRKKTLMVSVDGDLPDVPGVIESNRQRSHTLNEQTKRLPGGRSQVTWETYRPRLHETYILQ